MSGEALKRYLIADPRQKHPVHDVEVVLADDATREIERLEVELLAREKRVAEVVKGLEARVRELEGSVVDALQAVAETEQERDRLRGLIEALMDDLTKHTGQGVTTWPSWQALAALLREKQNLDVPYTQT